MRFTVTWTDQALDQLAALWLQQPTGERSVFAQRIDWLDRALRDNAHQKGARIAGGSGIRVLTPPEFFEPPTVGIAFTVSVEDRVVNVLNIREFSEFS